MAKITDPTELIGHREKAFDPECFWVITGYDHEEREFIMTRCQFKHGIMVHPDSPDMLTMDAAPTKRVSEFKYL